MRYLELCAGIGGFRQALDKLGCECVGYSEIDKYAIKLYSSYYKDERNFGDVTKINADELPDFDLLVGGFPCQAFSVAGKRGGFDDTRGTIFFDFARIMRAKKPKFAIFENVRGLLSHDEGRTYETMLNTLNELGYDAQWGILNTRFHGLPQNRERVYIVANIRERSSTKILFKRGDGGKDKVESGQEFVGNYYTKTGKAHQRSGVISEKGIAPCLTATDYKEPRIVKIGALGGKTCQSDQVYSTDGVATTLCAGDGGKGAKTGLYKVGYLCDTENKMPTQGYQILDKNSCSPCLSSGGGSARRFIAEKPKVRRLTPLECFRLQGFSDDMVELGYKIGISDTQLYKMAGNAVSVPVVEWVAKKVLDWDNLEPVENEFLF